MIKLKQLWNKFRVWIGLFVAGVALSFLVLRKYIGDGLEQQREQFKKEEEAKIQAQQQLLEETKKLEEKKQKEITKSEEQNKEKLKKAVEKAKEQRETLKKLEKRDPQGFAIKLEEELSVKQKKKKGKPKRDE